VHLLVKEILFFSSRSITERYIMQRGTEDITK